jgi:hypothetical protein
MAKPERGAATATVKIDADLLRKAKQIAAMEDTKLTDYFDRLIRGPVERDHAKTMRRIVDEHSGTD